LINQACQAVFASLLAISFAPFAFGALLLNFLHGKGWHSRAHLTRRIPAFNVIWKPLFNISMVPFLIPFNG
jgi:hypothetical protein